MPCCDVRSTPVPVNALDVLSFFIADVAGLFALSAVYLTTSRGLGWSKTSASFLMSAIEVARILFNPIAGAFIDQTSKKKTAITYSLAGTAVTFITLAAIKVPVVVSIALIMQGAISCMYGPGINALSLDVVGRDAFPARTMRNEVARHAGMLFANVLPIVLVSHVGYAGYFLVLAAMAPCAGVAAASVPDRMVPKRRESLSEISEREISGEATPRRKQKLSRSALVFQRDALLFLGGIAVFHLGNSAQLPALGQKFDALYHDPATRVVLFGTWPIDGLTGIGLCTIIAQLVMIPVAILVKWSSHPSRLGLKFSLLLSYGALPIRSMINAYSDNGYALLSGQILDAVSAGANGVLSVLMLEHLARASPEHFAFLQGLGYTMIGVGASISNILTATIIDHFGGFKPAYQTLGVIATIPLVLTLLLKELGNTSAFNKDPQTLYRLKWGCITVFGLCGSCTAMITAWYLHLKFEDASMAVAILFSWFIAGGEYVLQVPANRIGAHKAGLAPAQLRGVAELATLVAFLVFQSFVLKRPVLVNHVIGFGIVFFGVLIVLVGPWKSPVLFGKVIEDHEHSELAEADEDEKGEDDFDLREESMPLTK